MSGIEVVLINIAVRYCVIAALVLLLWCYGDCNTFAVVLTCSRLANDQLLIERESELWVA